MVTAISQIAAKSATFVSRGDDSGTHKAELRLWQETNVNVEQASGTWYRETGAGMGTTLNIGIGMDGYVLTDRASWLSFGNRAKHQILVQGDPRLFNQYGIILVNPVRHPNTRSGDGQLFVDWMLSQAGQAAIAGYRVNGQQLFFPNAGSD